jgi:hypothetical protein
MRWFFCEVQLFEKCEVNSGKDKGTGPGAQGETLMNERTIPQTTLNQQAHPRYCPPPKQDPLKEALIATASLRLHLRRHRRDAGPQRLVVLDRLLDVSDAFGRSSEWLRGGTAATDNSLEELEQLATDSRAVPDALGVVAP